MTVFIKKGIKTKDIRGNSYRIIPPDEVLTYLNNDLISQDLSESPFVTICYCVYDTQARMLEYARGGHPYPLLVKSDGACIQLEAEGALLGIVEERFKAESVQLAAGDKLVLYSDGIDAATWPDGSTGPEAFTKACSAYRTLPLQELVERLSSVVFGENQDKTVEDDVTIIALSAE